MTRLAPVELLVRGRDAVSAMLERTEKGLRGWSIRARHHAGNVGTAFRALRNVIFSVPGALASLTGVGLLEFIRRSIDSADALEDMSQRLGETTEELSTLGYAAKSAADQDLFALELALKTASKNAVDTARGTGEAKQSFSDLGIDVRKTKTELKGGVEILKEVADQFALMEDGAIKNAHAQRIFGESGAALIPLLNEGAAGIEKMQQRARDLGAELDTNTALRARQFKDNITDLETSLASLGLEMSEDVLPELVKVSGRLAEAAANGTLFNVAVDEGIRLLGQMERFLSGNEDGLKGLHQELDAATTELERLRRKQKRLLEDQVIIDGYSGPQLVRARKAVIQEIRDQQTLITSLQKKFNQGLTNLANRREQAERERLERIAKIRAEFLKSRAAAGLVDDPSKAGGDDRNAQRAREREEREALEFNRRFALAEIRRQEAADREYQQKEDQALRLQQQSEFFLMGEFGRLQQQEQAKLQMVRGFAAAEEAIRNEFLQRRVQARIQAHARELQSSANLYGGLANLAAQGGSKLHAVSQSLYLGQAIMGMNAAAAQALAIPPAPNIAAAAKARTLGAINVATIAAQAFGAGGGGGGGASLGGGFGGFGGFTAPAPPPVDPINPPPSLADQVQRLDVRLTMDRTLSDIGLTLGDILVNHAKNRRVDLAVTQA